MIRPVLLRSLLAVDQEQVLAEVQEQLGRLTQKVVLARLAARRRGDCELAEARLERLGQSLQHAAEDARSAQRAMAQESHSSDRR